MNKKTIIKTSDLSKVYGQKSNTFHALKKINIEIFEGEFLSVMGPSGSGKTTLMNMIGALDRPTTGSIEIDGINTTDIKEGSLYSIRREKIGFIFQRFYLIPTLTVLDNVLVPLLPLKPNKSQIERAKMLLNEVGLKDRIKHRPNEISGGQLQRVAIARSLIMNPAIILADEPTGNLDSTTGAEIIKLMKKINKEYKTTFMIVTHDPRIAASTERTIFLKDGAISEKPSVIMDDVKF